MRASGFALLSTFLAVLAGCVSLGETPVDAAQTAGQVAAASEAPATPDEPAAADGATPAPRIKEGTFHFTVGVRPGIVIWNGDIPEMAVAPGESLLARAEWTARTPAAAQLVLRILQADEVVAEVTGASPLEMPWGPFDRPARMSLSMEIPAPGAAPQQDVALTLIAGLAPLAAP